VSRADAPEAVSRAEALEAVGASYKGAIAAMRRMKGRETHRPGELSFAQYGLLFGLSDGVPRSSRELAHAADVSPATAAQMLDALAASGLVERVRSSADKRVVLTSLSDRGRALVVERRALFEPRWREALADFDDEDLLIAAAVLDCIRRMFDEFAEDPLAPEHDQLVNQP
jgi:DNA-binding MarR family transcriptional regulator